MLTLLQVQEALKAVVAEVGEDHVYDGPSFESGTSCVYIAEGKPQCIVAHVLARLLPDTWASLNAVRYNESASSLAIDDEIASDAAAHYLRTAQCQQDSGETWGAALAVAEQDETPR